MLDTESFKKQFIRLFPIILICFIPAILLVVGILIVIATTDIQSRELIQDPAQVIGFPRYIGLISNIGILFWAFSSSIYIFSYLVLRNNKTVGNQVGFLLVFGLITAMFMVDDLFRVHEYVGTFLGGTEFRSSKLFQAILFILYILVFLIFTYKYRKVLPHTDYILFLSTILFFGLSLIIDMTAALNFFNDTTNSGASWKEYYLSSEDFFKLFGIISWFAYTTSTSIKFIRNQIPND